jgi:hypothetical protein
MQTNAPTPAMAGDAPARSRRRGARALQRVLAGVAACADDLT